MSSEWPVARLGDLTSKITKGTTPKSFISGSAPEAINFIKVETISQDGRLIPGKFAAIDVKTNALLSRSVLQEDDLLFTIAGTIGRVARVRNRHLPANTNQAVAIVRADKSLVDIGYLSYVLGDRVRLQQAQSRVVQSVQANFSLTELADLEVPLPPLAEQRRIAGVLGALDDLIEVNQALIRDLMSTSSAIVQSCASQARSKQPLSELVEPTVGGVWGVDSPGNGLVPVLVTRGVDIAGLRHLQRVQPPTRYVTAEQRDSRKVKEGDLVIEASGTNCGRIWVVIDKQLPDDTVFSNFCKRFELRNRVSVGPRFLQHWLNEAFESGIIETFRTGTAMPNLDVNRLLQSLNVPVGPEVASLQPVLLAIDSAAIPLNAEITQLEAVRGELLPLLMSGRVRVSEEM